MNRIKQAQYNLETLCVYDVGDDPVLRALRDLAGAQGWQAPALWASFYKCLARSGFHDNLKGYVEQFVLSGDNVFTRAAAAGRTEALGENLLNAVRGDLQKLEYAAGITPDDCIRYMTRPEVRPALEKLPVWRTGSASVLGGGWDDALEALEAYHRAHGYGIYSRHRAFTWRDGGLHPVTSCNPIRIHDLKSYEKQRQKVLDNTENFLLGLPASNILLYGDRGTGKSSTVHAVLNEYAHRGLRLIEVNKAKIARFPEILEQVKDVPMKFILFIDDLSFSSEDENYARLKAVLEGSVSARQDNTLIYATSNRRHLLKETFSARDGDEVHRGDTIQESMSLSDRFGLVITFMNPDKRRYFEILDKIAADRKLEVDLEKLHSGAERWALERGGRSPRIARQYVDRVEGCVRRGLEWK